jgi:hypothetical protein
MHIILGDNITEEMAERYIVLELDSFLVPGKDLVVSAFCLIENVPIAELAQAHHFQDLHAQMIKNYRSGNWKFCQDALEHLQGRWNGEVDSFYQTLSVRISDLEKHDPAHTHWDPVIKI